MSKSKKCDESMVENACGFLKMVDLRSKMLDLDAKICRKHQIYNPALYSEIYFILLSNIPRTFSSSPKYLAPCLIQRWHPVPALT